MNFLTTPILYGLCAIAIAAGLFAGVQTVRLSSEKADHAETRADHADVLREIADKTAEAARLAASARAAYDAQALADQAKHSKEIDDAFERGRDAAAGITAGAVRVRTVWRERQCPQAFPGPSAQPADGVADVDPGRAEAIGRILGLGGSFDADYRLAYERLTAAQGLLNACYQEPAESSSTR
jgi:hypothetical protein